MLTTLFSGKGLHHANETRILLGSRIFYEKNSSETIVQIGIKIGNEYRST